MPQISLEISTENLNRVKSATGLTDNAQVKTWVISLVKSAVRNEEISKVESTETSKVETATQAAETAKQAAVDAVLSQSELEIS